MLTHATLHVGAPAVFLNHAAALGTCFDVAEGPPANRLARRFIANAKVHAVMGLIAGFAKRHTALFVRTDNLFGVDRGRAARPTFRAEPAPGCCCKYG